jgi:hypothetical protein
MLSADELSSAQPTTWIPGTVLSKKRKLFRIRPGAAATKTGDLYSDWSFSVVFSWYTVDTFSHSAYDCLFLTVEYLHRTTLLRCTHRKQSQFLTWRRRRFERVRNDT